MGKKINVFINTSLYNPENQDSIYAPVISSIKALKPESGDSFETIFLNDSTSTNYKKKLEEYLDNSDFYLLILDKSIIKKTKKQIEVIETEFDLAKDKKKDILVFLHKDVENDNNYKKQKYLNDFIRKISKHQTSPSWNDIEGLSEMVLEKIYKKADVQKPPSDYTNSQQNNVSNSYKGGINFTFNWLINLNLKPDSAKSENPFVKFFLGIFKVLGKILMAIILAIIPFLVELYFDARALETDPTPETTITLETIMVSSETPPSAPTTPPTTSPSAPTTPPNPPPSAPTFTPSITSNPYLENIKVGVFTHGDGCDDFDKNSQIIAGLQQIGFTATEVAYNSTDDISDFNVLYVPNGWGCTNKYFDDDDVDLFNKIYEYLKIEKKGLLIGDPIIQTPFTPEEISIDFLGAVPFKFSSITPEWVVKQTPTLNYLPTPTVDSANCLGVFEDFEPLPRAETKLEAPCANPPGTAKSAREKETCRRIIINNYSENEEKHISVLCSWESEKNDVLRFIVMPGSEYGVSDHQISATLMKRIILWLAHDDLNK